MQRTLACSLVAWVSLCALASAQDGPARSVDLDDVRATSLPCAMSYAAARTFRAAGSPTTLAPQSTAGSGGTAAVTSELRIPLEVGIEGDAPTDVEITSDGRTALVVCRDSDSVEFFDVRSGTRLGRVVVSNEPIHVALTPDGRRALVSCVSADTLCIVDVPSRTLVHSVFNVGVEPYRSVSTSDGARAIVGSVGTWPSGPGEFTVVDIASGQILSRIQTPVQGPTGSWFNGAASGVIPADFELSPDDQRIVLANYSTRQVLVYDVASGVVLVNVDTAPRSPTQVELDRAGTKAVVLLPTLIPGDHQSALLVVDLPSSTHSIVPITPSPFLGEMTLTRDGRKALFGTFEGLYAVDMVTFAQQIVDVGTYTLASIEPTYDGRSAIVSMFDTKLIQLSTMSIVSTDPSRFVFGLAASPVALRALGLSPWVDESLRAYTTANQSMSLLWTRTLGEGVELDAPTVLDLTGDGLHAAVCCAHSSNVAFVDLEHRAIESITPVNGAPQEIAVSPVADLAIVGYLDLAAVAVVDLSLGQILTQIPVPGEPWEVEFSPDGAQAYVHSSVPQTITFLDVAGAATQATGSLALGDVYGVSMELSPAGDVLALLSVAPDRVMLVDTATRTAFAVLPLPLHGTSAEFTPDGTKLVINYTGASNVAVVDVAGAASSVTLVSEPSQLMSFTLDATGRYAYFVANVSVPGSGVGLVVRVLDLQTNLFVHTVDLPQSAVAVGVGHFPLLSKRLGDRLIVCDSEYRRLLWRVRMAGPASFAEEVVPGAWRISFAETSQSLGTFVASLPMTDDELQLVHFGGDAVVYCDPATPNSTGLPARVAAYGTFLAGEQPLRIRCDQLPPNRMSMLLFGNAAASAPPPFGMGTVCIGGQAGRFSQAVQNSGAGGQVEFDVDIQALPLSPQVAVAPGDTWRFQVWYRDFVAAPTANLSSAVAVAFE